MPSKSNPDLDLSIRATAEDVAALERVRELDRLDAVEYLRFLKLFSERHPPSREIPTRHEPFVL